MKMVILLGLIMLLTGIHEGGHILTAKLLGITIEKVGFRLLPIPQFYVRIFENRLPKWKRDIFLLSGSFFPICIFIVILVSKVDIPLLKMACSLQIIGDSSPFMSDYNTILFRYCCQKQIATAENIATVYRQGYLYSRPWIIHFILWATLAAFLLKNFITPVPLKWTNRSLK